MKNRGYYLENETIVVNRELTELDIFVKKFLDILKNHSDYLVVSGFVSIATGRTRGTEDVDIISPLIDKDKFVNFFEDLQKNGFWCYQADYAKEAYAYFKNLHSLRFAKINELFPNIKFIPFNETKKAKTFEFNHPQKIKIKDFRFKIPPIEFEISPSPSDLYPHLKVWVCCGLGEAERKDKARALSIT